jgi:hypothetical protein
MMVDLDDKCLGFGPACCRCGIALPDEDDAPRKCPDVNGDVDRETVKRESPFDYAE